MGWGWWEPQPKVKITIQCMLYHESRDGIYMLSICRDLIGGLETTDMAQHFYVYRTLDYKVPAELFKSLTLGRQSRLFFSFSC